MENLLNKSALENMRSMLQSNGFVTRTYINEQRQWALEIIRKSVVRSTMLFDYKTEEMITII